MFDFTSQYQDNQPGNKDKMTYLINWLSEFEVQSNIKCGNNSTTGLENEFPKIKILHGPFNNINNIMNVSRVEFIGNEYDINGIPIGKAKIKHTSKPSSNSAFYMSSQIKKISGNFVNGSLNGNAVVSYKDLTKMKVNLLDGVVNGLVWIYDKYEDLQGFGIYTNGLPNGPFWFVYENQYVQLYFERGHVIEENCMLLDVDERWAKIGSLKNQSYLQGAQKFEINVEIHKCMNVIQLPTNKHDTMKEDIRLPIKISSMPDTGRIMVRPSNILYFNKIPKTASMGFQFLLQSLGYNLGYDIDFGERWKDEIFDIEEGIESDLESFLEIQTNFVRCRHYSFYDLNDWGYSLVPDWFTMIRDPIERVMF